MNNIEIALVISNDMFTNCLTKAGHNVHGHEMGVVRKFYVFWGGIGDLNINGECLHDLKAGLWELETKYQ